MTEKRVTTKQIPVHKVLREVKDDSAGGIVMFIGSVRNSGDRGAVSGLEYQAYEDMAEKLMRNIESDVKAKWRVKKIRMMHRVGGLKIGEVSVVVAVSAEHRAEAFDACRYAIDRIKSTLPIWKKEEIGGTVRWVEGTVIRGRSLPD